MKNMAMSNLCLVNPKIFPSAEATSRAAGSDDILAKAQVYTSLEDAIGDCEWVFGTSARCRTISWPEVSPRECAEKIRVEGQNRKVAIVFGRENSGLKNHELDLCQFLLRIPCNNHYSSLNIAAAVQVICYELFVAANILQPNKIGDKGDSPPATAEQMELFYGHLHEALLDIGFILHPDKSKSIMRRLRRIYNRIQLDNKEVDMLRGILRMAQGNKRNH